MPRSITGSDGFFNREESDEPAAARLPKAAKVDKKKRTRNYEDKKRQEGAVITLRMDPDTIERFKQMVTENEVLQGDLGDKLLTYAMDAVASGELVLVTRQKPSSKKTLV